MAKVNQLKAGSILSYLQMALSIVINLAYTPIMIRILGQSEYGLYNVVASTVSLLSILNLGFNSSYIRYYAKYKKEDDEESIAKLNGLFLIIFLIIGAVGLACGLFLSFHLKYVFADGLTSAEYNLARTLMILLTVNLAVSFPMSVFSNIISAHERYVFLKILGMLRTVGGPLVTIPLLLSGFRSVAIVVVTLCISLVVDVAYLVYVKCVLRQRFVFRQFEKGLFRSLLVYTSFIAINLIVDQINWNIDKFLLGRFQGTAVVAVYSVGWSLYHYYMMFSTAISSVFTPRIHRIARECAEDEVLRSERFTELFVKVGRIQFALLGLLGSGIVFFGKPFIHFWAGAGYGDAYYVALLLVLPASIALIQNLGIEIQRALDLHKFRSIVYVCMAALNLVATVFLCQRFGAIGAAIGTAISLIVANGLIMNIYYHKRCGLNVWMFWKNILRMCLGLLPPIACGVLIAVFVDLYVWWVLLLCIVGYTCVYAVSMWLLGLNTFERDLVRKPLSRLFRRGKHDRSQQV